jgi:hypothetical protein
MDLQVARLAPITSFPTVGANSKTRGHRLHQKRWIGFKGWGDRGKSEWSEGEAGKRGLRPGSWIVITYLSGAPPSPYDWVPW